MAAFKKKINLEEFIPYSTEDRVEYEKFKPYAGEVTSKHFSNIIFS